LLETKDNTFRAATAVRTKITDHWRGLTQPFPELGVRLINHDQVASHQAVHDELERLQVLADTSPERPSRKPARSVTRNGYARENANGWPVRAQRDRSRVQKLATPNQVKAIVAIARRQNTDLGRLLQQEYQVERPDDLTIGQASELIDLLKAPAEA
jgi:hypothetical protein